MSETVEHISGGTVEIHMTEREKYCCAAFCASWGDPPCWKLPKLTSDWPQGEPVKPCNDCKDTPNE